MPANIDLHMHTYHSDGVLAPMELLDRVRASGLTAFSVTDHDTLVGWRAVASLLTAGDPELISGTELSVRMGDDDVHILAYLLDPDNTDLNAALDFYQAKRRDRGDEMVTRLQNLGLGITFDDVKTTAGDGVIGRPHVAQTLFQLGLTRQYEEAFYKYIGNGGPAYVPKYQLTPADAFRLVHQAGGIVMLAHPALGEMWRHVEHLVSLGLDGIEAYHYSHKPADIKKAKQAAKSYDLVLSGGSDFHGRGVREAPLGSLKVPPEYLGRMKERAQTHRRTS
jgi:predicted metal-dependent phosphoesterase TrpH